MMNEGGVGGGWDSGGICSGGGPSGGIHNGGSGCIHNDPGSGGGGP
jgi:hypothetical protein